MKLRFKSISTFWFIVLVFAVFFQAPSQVFAQEGSVLGMHILHPYEINDVAELFEPVRVELDSETSNESVKDNWNYVTIPLPLSDLDKHDQWQLFFDESKKKKLIPIVRLTTRFENGAWQVPNRKEITDWYAFLKQLEWPTDQKHVIILNEPNHAAEFGGTINPEKFAEITEFAVLWGRHSNQNFVVLPGALDLAAPNGPRTMEAFTFLDRMLAHRPDVFNEISAWNSHSYANPGFSSSPQRTDKMSLRGFQHELSYLKEKTGKDYQVYITETGWVDNYLTSRWLESYYLYAYQHVWSDPRVVAVTPFVLRGDPGPFSGFTFLDSEGNPTRQYQAFKKLVEMEG